MRSKQIPAFICIMICLFLASLSAFGGNLPGVAVNHPKPGEVSPSAYCGENPFFTSPSAGGGQCTAFCWGRAKEKLGISLPFRRDAASWWSDPQGFQTGQTAKANSIVVWTNGGAGHVGFVEEVVGEQVLFNEANWYPSDPVGWGWGYSGDNVNNPGPKSLTKTNIVDRGSYHLEGYIYLAYESPRRVISKGTGKPISGAVVKLTVNGKIYYSSTDTNGYWWMRTFPTGTIVDVSIYKIGYQYLHYNLTATAAYSLTQSRLDLGAATAEDPNNDPLIPDSTAPTSTRFQLNDHVQVCNTGVGLRARYPQYDSPAFDVMDDGEKGQVIGGPVSYNGYQWWLIQYDRLWIIPTWSAEGEPGSSTYYLTKISVPTQPELNVSPSSQSVGAPASLAYFNVSNGGTGNMIWTATSLDNSWLHVTSGGSGTNAGTIQCSCDPNSGSSQRTGTIQITAAGATGSPKSVTVTQAGSPPPSQSVMGITYQSLNGPQINPGDYTPSTSDGTDFGNIQIRNDTQPAVRIFVVQSFGNAVLQFTGSPRVQISGDSSFYISSQPPVSYLDPWSAGYTPRTGFNITFDPHTAGLHTAIVSIPSNDSAHSPYQFAIQGTGVLPVTEVGCYSPAGGATLGLPIVASVADESGIFNGLSDLRLKYYPGTQVTFTAPATFNGWVFDHWSGYSSDYDIPNGTSIDFMSRNYDNKLWANYRKVTHWLGVGYNGASGFVVTASPPDNFGTTSFNVGDTLIYDGTPYVAVTAPATTGGKVFTGWTGVDGQNGCVGYVTMDADKTIVADYSDPAVVSIIAIDSSACEETLDPGKFSISRAGTVNQPLSVNIRWGGTAVKGTDFTSLSSPVVIPIGVEAVEVNVMPKNDGVYAGEKTVVLSLNDGTGYTVSPVLGSAIVNLNGETSVGVNWSNYK